jgi:vacuolar iron transporter family protein
LAMTSALNGAGVGFGTVAIAGLAFGVAGALSMFFSSYLSRRSELRSLRIDMEREMMEIETEPEEEKAEMRELLGKDGFDRQEVDVIIRRLEQDKDLWLKEMLRRELKVNVEDLGSNSFAKPALAGISFLLLALLAVSPYGFAMPRVDALMASVGLSLLALFALGSRAFLPRNFELRAGVESALVGAVAGGLLYLVGILISNA